MFDVYEKVSVETPAVESGEYHEVKRWAEKGERIRIVDRDSGELSYEQGAEFVVNNVDGDGDVRVTAGGSDYKLVFLSEYVVLEPIASPAPTYREVKRKAVIGERIKITKNGIAFKEGDIIIVHERAVVRDNIIRFVDGTYGTGGCEYVVLEPVNAQAKAEPERLTVGDYAKIIADAAGLAKIGAIIKITKDRVDNSAPYDGEYADGTTTPVYFRESELEAATEAEFLAQRKPAEPVRLNGGDYAKVTQSGHESYGSVVVITSNNRAGRYIYSTKNIDGTPADVFALDGVTPATAEGVAEAQEIAKWNAIGRKVGEFKRGDIVSFTRTDGEKGVGTVEDGGDLSSAIGVRMGATIYDGSAYFAVSFRNGATATLITPVEQRFDTEQAAA
ncbi:hypothetical protein MHB77_32465 [Paenibacillus sp. FSL K6-3166]|uniref:hypothetical protein n=1 Tax=unclassified Paenibacillus TaxID=185978 RepID=UPI00117D983A|nr:hypothetical protein [Paenibacillus sp. VTT E-133291]